MEYSDCSDRAAIDGKRQHESVHRFVFSPQELSATSSSVQSIPDDRRCSREVRRQTERRSDDLAVGVVDCHACHAVVTLEAVDQSLKVARGPVFQHAFYWLLLALGQDVGLPLDLLLEGALHPESLIEPKADRNRGYSTNQGDH